MFAAHTFAKSTNDPQALSFLGCKAAGVPDECCRPQSFRRQSFRRQSFRRHASTSDRRRPWNAGSAAGGNLRPKGYWLRDGRPGRMLVPATVHDRECTTQGGQGLQNMCPPASSGLPRSVVPLLCGTRAVTIGTALTMPPGPVETPFNAECFVPQQPRGRKPAPCRLTSRRIAPHERSGPPGVSGPRPA
jgi:hypothetical protein